MTNSEIFELLRVAGQRIDPPMMCPAGDLLVGDVFLDDDGHHVACLGETLGEDADGRVYVAAIGPGIGDDATVCVREPVSVLYRMPRKLDYWVLDALSSDHEVQGILFRRRCWKCKELGLAFGLQYSGVAASDGGLFKYKLIVDSIRHALTTVEDKQLRLGTVKRRYSGTTRSSYFSQGCSQCDALWGDFPLTDEFTKICSMLGHGRECADIVACWNIDLRPIFSGGP